MNVFESLIAGFSEKTGLEISTGADGRAKVERLVERIKTDLVVAFAGNLDQIC